MAACLALAALGSGAAGCGGKDFENRARPPVPVELSGVITEKRVTISPDKQGAGPLTIVISNQTKDAHTVTLDGEGVSERVGPVNPLDTATIQKTLKPGDYQVRAGSDVARPKEIEPAQLTIGPQRDDSNDKLLLP